MNTTFLAAQLGRVVQLLGCVLTAVAVLFFVLPGGSSGSALAAELSLLYTGLAAVGVGSAAWFLGRGACTLHTTGIDGESITRPYRMTRREAALLTTLSWAIGGCVAATPFLVWAHTASGVEAANPFSNAINCLFEATSGLTTTGATILQDIEAVPDALLFWRSILQWLGGLGILVLFVAVLPGLGIGAKRLFQFEAPGPDPAGPRPSVRDAARRLWQIYLGLTVTLFMLLLAGGMGWFDAANHTFTTMATGGFSTKNASIGRPDSLYIDIVLIVFMIVAASNFGVLHALLKGRWRAALADTEFKVFLSLLAIGSTVVAIAVVMGGSIELTDGQHLAATPGEAIRQATFTVTSQQTSTGYATSDWDLWPVAAKTMVLLLMFVGGSAGSTAGGVKVIRIWIAARVLLRELERFFRPDVVRPLRVGSRTIDTQQQTMTLVFLLGMITMIAIGTIALLAIESSANDISFATAASASLATTCTIGPGIDAVGATCNYGWLTDPSKLLLCFLMLVGRLEFFVVLVLLQPRFWRSS
ncbi:MAG: TrkH family potassium uptake protein [Phycisphaerales bacterium]|nr:TrkH family potassium uptake protein [Phycisphaerales bacterium]